MPVKGPLEQELTGSFRETRPVLVGLEDLTDHVVKPDSPLLQGALLLQRSLEVLLESLHHALLALADPGCLLLHNIHAHVRPLQPTADRVLTEMDQEARLVQK